MRESVKNMFDGFLAKLAVLTLALSLVVALGLNPVVMQRHMANAGPTHEVVSAEMPAMAHEAQHAPSGEFCVQMAPCTAIISQAPELRVEGIIVARVAPAPMPLADSRALAPPFHPPIV
jgi:hypothetical protein